MDNAKWVVVLADSWDYKWYDARWMHWDVLGNDALVPDVDIVDDHFAFTFDNERDALNKMKELWAQVQV